MEKSQVASRKLGQHWEPTWKVLFIIPLQRGVGRQPGGRIMTPASSQSSKPFLGKRGLSAPLTTGSCNPEKIASRPGTGATNKVAGAETERQTDPRLCAPVCCPRSRFASHPFSSPVFRLLVLPVTSIAFTALEPSFLVCYPLASPTLAIFFLSFPNFSILSHQLPGYSVLRILPFLPYAHVSITRERAARGRLIHYFSD